MYGKLRSGAALIDGLVKYARRCPIDLKGLRQLLGLIHLMLASGTGPSEAVDLLKEALINQAKREAEAEAESERPLPEWLY